ncbi:hypothetical protein ACROYT_G026021 [Oculina patagonica]
MWGGCLYLFDISYVIIIIIVVDDDDDDDDDNDVQDDDDDDDDDHHHHRHQQQQQQQHHAMVSSSLSSSSSLPPAGNVWIIIACLLAFLEVGSSWRQTPPVLWSLRSQFRHNKPCIGGSLVRIDTNQCKVSSAGRRQCKAKCNGSSTRDPQTRFSFVKIRGRKCIQFTDDRDGTKYALKVINGTNVTFELSGVMVRNLEFTCHVQRQNRLCSGGNLIKINIDQCKLSSAGKRQCEAKCNGWSSRDPHARFTIVESRGKKCIQYTDVEDGTKYALKVINGTYTKFEEKARCDSTIGHDFLFEEEKVGKLFKYKYMATNTAMYLGVSSDCDENLSLISSTNNRDRRCSFKVLARRSRSRRIKS